MQPESTSALRAELEEFARAKVTGHESHVAPVLGEEAIQALEALGWFQ